MLGLDARAARITWTVVFVLLCLLVLWLLRNVLFLLLLSLFFAYLLLPVADFVDRLLPPRIPRKVILVGVYLCVLALIGFVAVEIGTRAAEQAMRLQEQLPALQRYATDLIHGKSFTDLAPWQQRAIELLRQQLVASTERIVPLAQAFGARALSTLGSAAIYLLVLVFGFFFLLEGQALKEGVLALSKGRAHTFLRDVTGDIDLFLGAYIRALITIGAITFALTFAALSLLGMPYALLLAVLGGCLEIIPVIGPLISAVVGIAVAAFSGHFHLWWVVAYYVILRLVQDYVVQPRVFAAGVKLNPLLILIGVFAGEQLGGVAGIFLSIPVIAVLRIVIQRAQAV